MNLSDTLPRVIPRSLAARVTNDHNHPRNVRSGVTLLLAAFCLVGAPGCVERLLQVRSDPPGAEVSLNGTPVGTTPLDHPFVFYGTVSVVLRRDGYVSKRVVVPLEAPWYEYFPLDFVTEFFIPWKLKDYHLVQTTLEVAPDPTDEAFQRELEDESQRMETLASEPDARHP